MREAELECGGACDIWIGMKSLTERIGFYTGYVSISIIYFLRTVNWK